MQIGKYLSKKVALAAALTMIPVVTMGIFVFAKVRSFSDVRAGYHPSDVWVVDRHGYPMESIRRRSEKRNLEWVEWADVSTAFQSLLVQTEDRRFYIHPGVDWLASSQALVDGVSRSSFRGASTLTMQLVSLLDRDSASHQRSLLRKFRQMLVALKLDSVWHKTEILEAYVNLVPFRGELVGLRAASLGYFGKNPSGLNSEEAALLVALIRSPNSTPELVSQRACWILKAEDCTPLLAFARQTLSEPYRLQRTRSLLPIISPNFIESEKGSSVIRSSLDRRVQDLAMHALREQIGSLKNQNVNDGAILVLETDTGRVVAYAANGGPGYTSAEQIDGVQTKRQAGSTIKPFVYATAFDLRLLAPDSLLNDSPTDISVSQGRVYHPRNYDQIFRGNVSVGEALGSSMNVPAVRALQLVGEDKVLANLRALGMKDLFSDDYYGPSLALGSVDLTLWELTQGYRKLASEDSPFSPSTRLSIYEVLSAPEYRRFTFGMDSLLSLPFPAAVKTGTSKDMRDNWCIGWTKKYTVGVWIGNFNGKPMWNVSGMSGAAPIWRQMMLALHPERDSEPTHYRPPVASLPKKTLSRIRYPAADMLVGLDPDIPQRLQKLPIEIENPQRKQRLYLNRRFLSHAQGTTLLPIQRGKYLVELKSEAGTIVDSVKFEVR